MSEERFFQLKEIERAMDYAAQGGIAIHRNYNVNGLKIGGKIRSGPAFHVLGLKEPLLEWGRRHGRRSRWIQQPMARWPGVWHFDVFGRLAETLEARSLHRCGRCGKEAAGYAEINGVRYCHSDDPYPTCYMRESWERAGELSPQREER